MKEAGTSLIEFYLETNASVRIPKRRISSKKLQQIINFKTRVNEYLIILSLELYSPVEITW